MGLNNDTLTSNDNVVFVVQIEHQTAVNNIDEIFSSDNI